MQISKYIYSFGPLSKMLMEIVFYQNGDINQDWGNSEIQKYNPNRKDKLLNEKHFPELLYSMGRLGWKG